jgi:glutathione reductase (NADPH)
MAYDFDLVVIGAGSGGTRASRLSAGFGARVAVIEESRLGGTCVNLGCIPKKLFVYAAHYGEDFADAAAFGWDVPRPRFDFARLRKHKDVEIARLNGVYAKLLDDAGVTRIDGRARLVDAHSVAVGECRITAEHILVATGSWPNLPDTPGIEHALSSNDVFGLDRLPERVVVAGGGYIAVEFAGIFHGMGASVTQVYRGDLFLRGFDGDLRSALADEMRKRGIDLRFRTLVTHIEKTREGLRLSLNDGSTLEADALLCATGRTPNTRGLGLDAAGVATGPGGEILVDDYSRSNVPSIWAIGDVTDRINLTPVALHEGICFARTVFGGTPSKPDHRDVPTAVFSSPSLGTVGLTEEAARAQAARPGDVLVFKSSFKPLRHTLTGRDEKTLVKLVVDRASDRVLGAHMLGPEAGEILQGLGVAVKCGVTKAQLDRTIGIHPTSAEEFVTLREPVA